MSGRAVGFGTSLGGAGFGDTVSQNTGAGGWDTVGLLSGEKVHEGEIELSSAPTPLLAHGQSTHDHSLWLAKRASGTG